MCVAGLKVTGLFLIDRREREIKSVGKQSFITYWMNVVINYFSCYFRSFLLVIFYTYLIFINMISPHVNIWIRKSYHNGIPFLKYQI